MTETQLTWRVHVAPSVPTEAADKPPGTAKRAWSPISSTLISGERDAVLVDPPLTVEQNDQLVTWLQDSGKNLTAVYLTHGHGDHWFGLGTVLDQFPGARGLATPTVLKRMREQVSTPALREFWRSRFPHELPSNIVLPEELEGSSILLEGHELNVIELGHTDTDDTTCLHVPSIDLVVAGDSVYNDVHLYLTESSAEGRAAWLRALDRIESLAPRAVVSGHKRAGNDDDPRDIEQTRQYIRDFDELERRYATTRELFDAILERHRDRINSGALWGSCRAAKG
ncbi:MAG: fold metallo-hydrolase [Amycolatopsis sp.]|jgi:glyoxylase-like metal-dependent hydrolase (beta-lactamase superfamily II)|uniref:MBL fold metallo-hydrolase n=1 Tax=Amycolatopsis sp. TaxID=37632 RepID=UPI00262C3185|nr:MBL fold metallo-hydrolase [Amycolatopsis sp.]MCU1680662.1 fold metallo-hydrolase [Amycolatopsis sp.]